MTIAVNNVHHDAIQTTGGLAIAAKPSSWPYYRAGILMATGVVLAALTWVRGANQETTPTALANGQALPITKTDSHERTFR